MTNEQPKWVKNKLAYTKEYNKTYRKEKRRNANVGLFLPRDNKRIKTWDGIKKKADFLRVILDAYANGELDHLNIEERIKNVD